MSYTLDAVAGGRGNSTQHANRAAFNGKGLTFVEIVFGQSITESATTPDAFDSLFEKVIRRLSSANNGVVLLAQNYMTGRKATTVDTYVDTAEAQASTITAGDSVDVYQFMFEGLAINIAPNSQGASTQEAVAAAIAEAEADILTEVKDIASGDSSNDIAVKVRVLTPEGTSSSGAVTVFGMLDGRGAA